MRSKSVVLTVLILVAFAASSWAQTFTDVTATANIGDVSGSSAAWGDYNNDGFYDLYVVASSGTNKLYKNTGSGFLPDSAYSAQSPTYRGNVSFVDFDSDGDTDISVIGDANYLLANASGVFSRVSAMTASSDHPSGSAWADYDNDGDLDLYISSARGIPVFYKNDAGVFSNVVRNVGLDSDSYSGSFAWGDYDNDGYPDLYVADNTMANGLYRNTGSGLNGIGLSQSAGGTVSWSDYDNDSDLDLFLLYEGLPMQIFRNVTGAINLTPVVVAGAMGNDMSWSDYDNDGDQDLFVSMSGARSKVFQNNGNGTFSEVSVAGLTGASAEGAVWVDYDNDGDQDLFLVGTPCKLLRNGGTANRWLAVKPTGTTTNKSAIGVSVTIVTGGKHQRQYVGFASSRSQSTIPVLFGLGSTAAADSVIVRWSPTSAQAFTNVSSNQSINITQGSGGFTITPPTGGGSSTGGGTGGGTTGTDTTTTPPPVTAPGVTITPVSVVMDSTTIWRVTQKTFVVRNDGTATLHITNVVMTGDNSVDFTVSPTSVNIEVGGSRLFTITGTPSAVGTRQAKVRLTHDASGGVSEVPVTGKVGGVADPSIGPQISLSTTSIVFDTTATGSISRKEFAVTNNGTMPLIITGMTLDGRDFSHFEVAPSSVGINPGQTWTFQVTFRPALIGEKEAAINILTNLGGGTTARVMLRGFTPIDRTPPRVSLSASVTRGVAPLRVLLTNQNSGGAITRWEWQSGIRDAYGVEITNRHANGDTLTVTYTRPGVYYYKLYVEGPGGSDARWSSDFGDSIVVTAPQPPMPVLRADTDTLNLGTIDVGATTTSNFQISNTGNATMSVGISIDGDNSFVVTSADLMNIAADTSDIRNVSLRFLPLSAGTKTGRLVISYNGDPGTRTIILVGTAREVVHQDTVVVPRPVFVSTVNSVDAGRITAVRARSSISFLVRNGGTATLTANVFYRGSTAFTVSPDSLSLAPGASDSILVLFAPFQTGTVSGRIYFNHNAGITPYIVNLAGEGIQFVMSAQMADFDNNGAVDLEDFFLLASEFDKPAGTQNTAVFDLNGDSTVNFEDFYRFSDYFGQEAPR